MRYQHLTGGASTNYSDIFQSNNDLKISTAGSLGIGVGATSNITLGADGSVRCVDSLGVVTANRANTQNIFLSNNGVITSSQYGNGTHHIGGTLTGSASSSTPNIELNANGTSNFQGSATFDGYILANSGMNITPGDEAVSIFSDNASTKFTIRSVNGTTYRVIMTGTGSCSNVAGGSWGVISSARRTKDILGDVDKDQAWDMLKNIDLKRFYYKNQSEEERQAQPIPYMGLIAEDAAALDPELKIVTDQTDSEGEIWSYNLSVLQMKSMAALSAALTRIETLEARLADAGL
jgi:hypothetical protein